MSRLPLPRWVLFVLFGVSLTLCLWCGQLAPVALSQRVEGTNAAQLVQAGGRRYQSGDYPGAIALWQQALATYQQAHNPTAAALVLENLARAAQQLGQNQAAITDWQQVIKIARQQSNRSQLSRALTEQAQAYSRIGQPQRAIALLCHGDDPDHCGADSALHLARQAQEAAIAAAALGSLGDAYRLTGQYELAINALQSSLALAEAMHHPVYQASVLNSLGTVHLSLAQINYRRLGAARESGDVQEADQFQQQGLAADDRAVAYFQQSLKLAQTQDDRVAQVRSQISAIPAYYRLGQPSQAAANWQAASQLLSQLPDSRNRVYAAIDLAQLLQPLTPDRAYSRVQCLPADRWAQAEALLSPAIAVATRIRDTRAASFALGELGHLGSCV